MEAEAARRRSAAGTSRRLLGLVVVGALTALLCAPFFLTVAWLGDEGVLLHGADRMLRGERLYLDFFAFLPPGGFVFTAAWLYLTEVSFAAARVLTILIVIGIACITYLACHRVTRNSVVSAVAVIAWVVMSQGEYTLLSHHWFTTLFCALALWALLAWIETPERRWWLIVVAGLAGGAAAMVTPTRGALVMLAGLAAFGGVPVRFRALAAYCAAGLIVPALLIAHVVAQGAWDAAFESVILHSATRYAGIQSVHYGAHSNPQNLLLIFVFPLAGFLTVLHMAQDWPRARRVPALRIGIAFGLAAGMGFLVRPDTVHIAYAAPLVLPLLLYGASRLEFPTFRRLRPAAITVVALIAVLPARAYLVDALGVIPEPTTRTPRGDVKLLTREVGSERAVQRIAALPANDTVLFYPYSPLLPFLTGRVHPARVDIFVPRYTTQAQFREACLSMVRNATWVVFDRTWTTEYWQQVFPAMRGAAASERMRFEEAIERNFVFVAREGAFEFRRRAPEAEQELCAIAAN